MRPSLDGRDGYLQFCSYASMSGTAGKHHETDLGSVMGEEDGPGPVRLTFSMRRAL